MKKNLEQRQHSNGESDRKIDRIKTAINSKKSEIKNYSKQLAKGLINEELFLEMIKESAIEFERLEHQLVESENVQELRDNEKGRLASAMGVLSEIIEKKELTNADVVILIDKISVHERKGTGGNQNKTVLDIEVVWNTEFLVIG